MSVSSYYPKYLFSSPAKTLPCLELQTTQAIQRFRMVIVRAFVTTMIAAPRNIITFRKWTLEQRQSEPSDAEERTAIVYFMPIGCLFVFWTLIRNEHGLLPEVPLQQPRERFTVPSFVAPDLRGYASLGHARCHGGNVGKALWHFYFTKPDGLSQSPLFSINTS